MKNTEIQKVTHKIHTSSALALTLSYTLALTSFFFLEAGSGEVA
jgi:hypothetical protein